MGEKVIQVGATAAANKATYFDSFTISFTIVLYSYNTSYNNLTYVNYVHVPSMLSLTRQHISL